MTDLFRILFGAVLKHCYGSDSANRSRTLRCIIHGFRTVPMVLSGGQLLLYTSTQPPSSIACVDALRQLALST